MTRFSVVLLLIVGAPAAAQVTDVPAGHWAKAAVSEVVARGVMKAPGGRFNGGATVTRRELTTTLAAFGRSLESGPWAASGAKPVKQAHRDRKLSDSRPISRYELAAVLSRAAAYIGQGLPRPAGKVFGASEALPDKPKVTLAKTDPAYSAVTYLVDRRMAFGESVVLKPGNQPVKPAELATAVAIVIVGLTDRLTDEPQNREDLGEPPSHRPKP